VWRVFICVHDSDAVTSGSSVLSSWYKGAYLWLQHSEYWLDITNKWSTEARQLLWRILAFRPSTPFSVNFSYELFSRRALFRFRDRDSLVYLPHKLRDIRKVPFNTT
jgi:hypothetical protein